MIIDTNNYTIDEKITNQIDYIKNEEIRKMLYTNIYTAIGFVRVNRGDILLDKEMREIEREEQAAKPESEKCLYDIIDFEIKLLESLESEITILIMMERQGYGMKELTHMSQQIKKHTLQKNREEKNGSI